MKYFLSSITLILCIFIFPSYGTSKIKSKPLNDISDYKPICKYYKDSSDNSLIAIRSFYEKKNGLKIPKYLLVNVKNLKTKIMNKEELIPGDKISEGLYFDLRKKASGNSSPLHNAGLRNLKHFPPFKNGFLITTDLCPSNNRIDKDFYLKLVKKFKKPFTVVLFPSGKWIRKYEKELSFFTNLNSKHKVNFIWGTHSETHFYDSRKKMSVNFILAPNTIMPGEVIIPEIELIRRGIVPSVFFRFPGLVSNKSMFNRIIDLGLIPLGSDSWIGKDEYPRKGSIVLLHGNGNERIGWKKFIRFLSGTNLKPVCYNP